jgi:quinol monooxygenase YgiN
VSGHVYWVFEITVQPGQADAFKALAEEMCAGTKANEPGTLAYDWHANADGKTFHIFEHYKDADAAMVHLGNFGKNYAKRFMPMVTPVCFSVYGSPNEDVKKALAGLGPVYYQPFAGFVR